MKRIIVAAAFAALSVPLWAQTNVGVSVHMNQPGLYGRVDIGNVPTPPVVIYQQPVVIVPSPVVVQQQPIYLHVPPGHAKHWAKHCGSYNACGQRVYFVQERWYQDQYVPMQRRHDRDRDDRDDHDGGRGHGRGHGKGHDRRD
jgi:hypothetical protein